MKVKRLFFLFNSFQFFFSLLLWVPIFYEYQKRIGLNDVEIFKIQSIYYLVFCLFEIPTGYIADLIGYRLCLILGSISLVVANLCVPLFPSYDGFLVHFVLIALARSFVSGASSAYLYEVLQQRSAIGEYKEAEGRARAYSLVGKVICWAMIGPIMQWHFTLPYWLTALNAAIGLLFAYLLPEFVPDLSAVKEKVGISFRRIFSTLRNNSYLFLIMLQGVALFVLTRICQVSLFQPILANKGFSVVNYGVVMSVMTLFEALGAFKSKWIKRYLSDLNAIFVLTSVVGFSFFLISLSSFFEIDLKIVTMTALCLFSYVIGISFPIQKQLMNEAIPERSLRASLLSFESIIDRAVSSLVAISLGAALQGGELLLFLRKSAVLAVLSVLIIAILIRRLRGQQQNENLCS
jgi:MFS family permease